MGGGFETDRPGIFGGARSGVVSKALRFHPYVADDWLVFTEERRALKKAVADLPEGHEVECWSARLKR